jgi:hypothetical protein
MKIEVLPPERYGELPPMEIGCLSPANSIALVARDNGRIVGCIFLAQPLHAEGVWEAPGHIGLGAKLIEAAGTEAKKFGCTKLFGYAVNEAMGRYFRRLGCTKTDLEVWSKEL